MCAVAFVVALGVFSALNSTARPTPVRRVSADVLTQRGNRELQRARETADPAHYARAEAAFRRALRRDPRSVDATIGMATLALARHEFRGGLRYAQRARRLGPELARPFSVLVDAQVELGRYAQAGGSPHQMNAPRPQPAAHAPLSVLSEPRCAPGRAA